MTEEEGEAQLEKTTKELKKQLKRQAKKDGMDDLTDNQIEAMASLAFNVGLSKVLKSDAWKALKRGDIETASFEFFDENKGFVRQGKKKMAGLVRRRAAERDLFGSA